MRIGIDLGGTKIEGVALDANGAIAQRLRVATPRDDYDGTVRTIAAIVADLEQDKPGIASVGIGIPGALCPVSGLVKNANSIWLNGMPLDKDLTRALHREVRIANDANCFALSEAVDGAGRGGNVVFGVILGTGCGGGIVVHGRLLTGPNALAGEWGHHPLPWPDLMEAAGAPSCYCGKVGCIETWISGPGLSADFERATGETADARTIAARAADGDPRADAALMRYETRLARALSQLVNILDPDIIVLGGGMSNVERLYVNVPPLMRPFIFGGTVRLKLARNVHGDSSGVRGAAWLWPEQPARQT